MPRRIEVDGKTHEFPDDATDDEISAALSGSPAVVAPTPEAKSVLPPAAEYLSRAAKPFVKGAASSLAATFNPMTYVRAAKALGGAVLNPSGALEGAMDAGRGVAEAVQTPEGAGELAGGLSVGAIPVGGAVSKLGTMAGYTRAARAAKIIRAMRSKGGPKATKAFSEKIHSMESEIDLPVSATHKGLARALKERRESAGAAVRSTEAALPVTDVAVDDIARRIPEPEGTYAKNAQGEQSFVPHDPAEMSSYSELMGRLRTAGGDAGTISTPDLISMKKTAAGKAAKGKAYETPAGDSVGITPEAWKAQAGAIRATLEKLPGPEAAKYSAARRQSHIAQTLETPASLETARLEKLPPYARGTEILLGRAGAAGRGGAVGALVGLAGGQFLDSTLYLTASAAVKKRVIAALESGQPQLASEILFKSAVGDRQRRREAERLLAQGEGVIAP